MAFAWMHSLTTQLRRMRHGMMPSVDLAYRQEERSLSSFPSEQLHHVEKHYPRLGWSTTASWY